MKIGIIYIATGIYTGFWKEFYPTCECFFCADAEKGFEVFTDSPGLLAMQLRNVCLHPIVDRGFILNVSSKSRLICELSPTLRKKYDYVFYMNGNLKFVAPIYAKEILPDVQNNYLTALSFDIYQKMSSAELPYDRNPDCLAYIPLGEGEFYYQGGFYGGRTEEMLLLSEWCAQRIDRDLNRKIVARYHDESYLNRYFIDYHPRILNEVYAKPSFYDCSGDYKAILLDKESYLGYEKVLRFKGADMDGSLSFLFNDDLRVPPIGIVTLSGRLGNQMFQFAFFLYLQFKLGGKRCFYLDPQGCEELLSVFSIPSSYLLPKEFFVPLSKVNTKQIEVVVEEQVSRIQHFEDSAFPIVYYRGYWQCCSYVNACAETIKTHFAFQNAPLNASSISLLRHIRTSCSVSIHIRRGDYLSPQNKLVYDNLCTLSYYKKAIAQIKKRVSEPLTFFIFTDDPEWVKKNLSLPHSMLIDCNRGADDWQDMALMAACRHHILANSSFSWWGAWLGDSSLSQVITPDWWYNGVCTPHLLPMNWNRISVRQPNLFDTMAVSLLLKGNRNQTLGLWEGDMATVLFFYHYGKYKRNKFCRELAYQRLEAVCKRLNLDSSYSFAHGLSGIACSVLYLIRNGFVKGNPNHLLLEVDYFLMEVVCRKSEEDLSFETGLCGVVSYFYTRLLMMKVSASKKHLKIKRDLENSIGIFLDDLLERIERNALPTKSISDIFVLLQQISEWQLYRDKVLVVYTYCMGATNDTRHLLRIFNPIKAENLS